jgi:hypothetical protein
MSYIKEKKQDLTGRYLSSFQMHMLTCSHRHQKPTQISEPIKFSSPLWSDLRLEKQPGSHHAGLSAYD